MRIKISALKRLIREALNEVDTDPSNNPGRPSDAYEYLGMRPKATAAMSHPSLDSGGGAAGEGVSSSAPNGGDIGAEFDAAAGEAEAPEEGAEAEVKESRRRRYR